MSDKKYKNCAIDLRKKDGLPVNATHRYIYGLFYEAVRSFLFEISTYSNSESKSLQESARKYLFFAGLPLLSLSFSSKIQLFGTSPFFLGMGSDLPEAKLISFLLSVLITGVWVVLGPCWRSCYRGCFLYPGALVRGF